MLKCLPSPIITWSRTVIPIIMPVSTNFFVISISSLLGVGSPEGCLCATIIWAADSVRASLTAYLGLLYAIERFKSPGDLKTGRDLCGFTFLDTVDFH